MIIVTGGAGFIGSAIIWELNSRGITDILVVDSFTTSSENWKNLINLKFRDYIDKDAFLAKIVGGKFQDISGIIHLGACSDTTSRDKEFLLKNNVEYSKNLAIWCVKNGKRFVYASSASTYGDGSFGFFDDPSILPKLKPTNLYGWSKHLFDLWVLDSMLFDRIAGLKYFNVYGPNEYHKGEMCSMVYKSFNQIKSQGRVKLFKSYLTGYKDGEQSRDFIYVKDVTKATLFIFDNHCANGIFNIGSGVGRTFYDLVLAVFKSMEISPKIEYIDMPENIKEHYQYFTCADITKLYKIGYNKKMTTLEDGISDYVKNYLMREMPYLSSK